MDLVVAGDDRAAGIDEVRAVGEPAFAFGVPGSRDRSTASEPISSQTPVSRATSRNAASTGWFASSRAFSRRSLPTGSVRPVFSGVRTKSAPPSRARRTRSETTRMLGS